MATKMMYIGAGLHLNPLDDFIQSAREFVFVDTLPRSEFDRRGEFCECFYDHEFVDKLINKCRAKGFILLLEEVLDGQYFTKILSFYQRWVWLNKVKQTFPYICPTRLTFYNNTTKQSLKYYVSTNIEHNMPLKSLANDLETCNGWIVSGFHPPLMLIYYIGAPLIMYGYSETIYKPRSEQDNYYQDYEDDEDNDEEDDDEKETIIRWMYEKTERKKKIGFVYQYFACNSHNGSIEECENILELNDVTFKMWLKRSAP